MAAMAPPWSMTLSVEGKDEKNGSDGEHEFDSFDWNLPWLLRGIKTKSERNTERKKNRKTGQFRGRFSSV